MGSGHSSGISQERDEDGLPHPYSEIVDDETTTSRSWTSSSSDTPAATPTTSRPGSPSPRTLELEMALSKLGHELNLKHNAALFDVKQENAALVQELKTQHNAALLKEKEENVAVVHRLNTHHDEALLRMRKSNAALMRVLKLQHSAEVSQLRSASLLQENKHLRERRQQDENVLSLEARLDGMRVLLETADARTAALEKRIQGDAREREASLLDMPARTAVAGARAAAAGLRKVAAEARAALAEARAVMAEDRAAKAEDRAAMLEAVLSSTSQRLEEIRSRQ